MIDGVRIAGISAGLKRAAKRDVFLAEMKPGTTIAGKLTKSQCPSAPVDGVVMYWGMAKRD